jgi:hypothetical protein
MYYISFTFKLEIEGDRVFIPSFAEWKDEERPIMISHPKVVSIFESEPAIDDVYGIVEESVRSAETPSSTDGDVATTAQASTAVVGLSGEIYAKKVADIPKSVSSALSKKLGEHLVKCSSEINQDEFFTDENNNDLISQIRETLELHDFWGRYVMSPKKMFKNGYVLVTKS